MRDDYTYIFGLLGAVLITALLTFAAPSKAGPISTSSSATTASAGNTPEQADAMRLEGEKRFHANCGRCHMAPHKYSPRVMATAVRHMRVRATITDDDMKYILYFLTQ